MRLPSLLLLTLALSASPAGAEQGSWHRAEPGSVHRVHDGLASRATPSLWVGAESPLLVELHGARAVRFGFPQGTAGELTLYSSSDGRLFAQTPWKSTPSGALVWQARPEDDTALLLLESGSSRVDVEVHLAELDEPIAHPFPHRIDAPSGPQIELRRSPGLPQRLDRLEPGRPWELEVHGPMRLRVQSRAEFSDPRDTGSRTGTLTLERDGVERIVRFVSSIDPAAVTLGPSPALGSARTAYYDVPDGAHRFRLSTTVAIWLELRAVTPRDLYPAGVELGPTPTPTFLQQRPTIVDAHLLASEPEAVLEHHAVSLLRDRSVRGSRDAGLHSAQSLGGATPVGQRRDTVRRLLTEYTAFRPLTSLGPTGPLGWARFAPPARRHPGPGAVDLRQDSLEAAAARTQLAAFHQVPAGDELRFAVGGDFSARRLRLAVQTDKGPYRGSLTAFDRGGEAVAERRVVVFPEPLLELGPTTAEAALIALHGRLQSNVTLRRPYGLHLRAAPFVDAAVGQWTLPQGTRSLTLRSETSARLALLEDFVPGFRLAEAELRELLSRGRSGARFAARVAELRHAARGPRPSARRSELSNHYRAAFNLLEIRALEFGRDTEPLPPRAPAQAGNIDRLVDLAQRRKTHELDASQMSALIAQLRERGEVFLASRLLQQEILHGGVQARAIAQRELDALYRETDDALGLLRLHAWSFLRDPRPESLEPLFDVLIASERETLALDLALLLPAEQRPRELLAAAARAGWWLTHDELVETLDEGEREEETARVARHAGLRAVEEASPAAAIRRALDSGDAAALSDWWSLERVGPKTSSTADELVTGAAGSVRTESKNSTIDGWFWVASPAEPLRLALVGPADFELEVRPVHRADDPEASDRRLQLELGTETRDVPLLGNRRSADLQLSKDHALGDGAAAGRSEVLDIAVSAGLLPTVVRSDDGDLLVRLRRRAAALEDPGLPSPLPAWWPEAATLSAAPTDQTLCLWDNGSSRCEPLLPAITAASPPMTCTDCRAEGRVAQRGHDDPTAAAFRLAADLLDSTEPPAREDLGRVLAALEAAPLDARISALRRRVEALSRWRLVGSIETTAGVQQRVASGSMPESPTLRTRFELLGRLPARTHVIYGSQSLAIALAGERSLELELEILRVPPLRRLPMIVAWAVDDLGEQTIELTPDESSRTVRLGLPADARRLTLRTVDPTPNQYLGATLWALRNGRREAIPPSTSRSYQVASRSQSLRLRARGPGLLRIDALGDGASRLITLDDGWQSLVLGPQAGQERTLYRVFERAVDPLATRETEPPAEPSDEPSDEVQGVPRLADFALPSTETGLGALFEARDSTLSVLAGGRRRRLLDEDDRLELGADEFVEAQVSWQRGTPSRQRQLRALGRVRENGDPTVGGSARWRFAPRASPYSLRLGGSVFGQDIDGRGEWAATLRASAGRRFTLSDRLRHRPQLSVFARTLSLDAEEAPATRVDQDVFTLYKAQHRAGVELADVLTYDAGLTTQWFTSGSIRSNEELDPTDPDRAELQLGLRQYLRPFLFDLRVRHALFFSDDDRSRSFDRTRLSLDLQWEVWNRQLERWALESTLAYDFGTDELVGAILFGRYFSAGRGLRDIFPEPGDYRQLRLFAPRAP